MKLFGYNTLNKKYFKRGENTQTYREFIAESEDYLGMDSADLDNMNDKELSYYLDFVDCLWGK